MKLKNFNYFIKKIQSIVVYITQLIETICSWHWRSYQILSLIPIGTWHYFYRRKIISNVVYVTKKKTREEGFIQV